MTDLNYAYSDAPLADTETANNAPGRASILRRLAGNASRLMQLITGEGLDDRPPTIPRNPSGGYGRNFSGPPWGPAIRHPLAWWGGEVDISAGNWDDTPIANDRTQWITVDSDTPLRLDTRIWVRPHTVFPGAPYSRGYWTIRARRASGSNATLTIQCTVDRAQVPSTTISVTSTGPNNFDLDADGTSSDPFYAPLKPGWNNVLLYISSNVATDVYIDSITLNQIVKRTH